MYSALDIVRIVKVSTKFCSFLPTTSFSNLFKEDATLPLSLKLSLCPKRATTVCNCANLSSFGSSCTRYTKVFLGLCFPINSETFLLASNINSSISLLASLLVLKWIPIGFASSSNLNLTSTLSKEIAPSRIRCERIFLANSSIFRMAWAISLDVSYAFPVSETSLGIVVLIDEIPAFAETVLFSIIACASS